MLKVHFENIYNMKIGVEISMYPLTKDFEPLILKFIEDLKINGLRPQTNGMSTQVFGEIDEVFDKIKSAVKTSMVAGKQVVFNFKVLNNPLPEDFKL